MVIRRARAKARTKMSHFMAKNSPLKTSLPVIALRRNQGTPRPTKMSNTPVPRPLATAMMPSPCLAMAIESRKSGTELPTARKVRPITAGGTVRISPARTALSTAVYAHTATHSSERPKSSQQSLSAFGMAVSSSSSSGSLTKSNSPGGRFASSSASSSAAAISASLKRATSAAAAAAAAAASGDSTTSSTASAAISSSAPTASSTPAAASSPAGASSSPASSPVGSASSIVISTGPAVGPVNSASSCRVSALLFRPPKTTLPPKSEVSVTTGACIPRRSAR
mmetsp:Transcript_136930/g.381735  ORF Transcript_136930/g.381735 Transcript_136930/m.381735 type:complete len:282 (+) Transcript_136930:408-1253(+)